MVQSLQFAGRKSKEIVSNRPLRGMQDCRTVKSATHSHFGRRQLRQYEPHRRIALGLEPTARRNMITLRKQSKKYTK